MKDVEFDTKELLKNGDGCGLDLETYNQALREKISELNLELKMSIRWGNNNPFAGQSHSNELEQNKKSNQELQHRIIELHFEKEQFKTQILTDEKIHELEKLNIELNSKLVKKSPLDLIRIKELEQEKIIISEINKELEEKLNLTEKEKFKLETKNQTSDELHELEKSNIELRTKLENHSENLLEAKKEKLLLAEKANSSEKISFAMMKKYYLTIALTGILFASVFVSYSFFVVSLTGEEYGVADIPSITSGYTIQNLKGDTIDTYLSWRLVQGDTISVNILNADQYDPEFIEAIKKTILSEKELEIDNSFLNKGPKGTTTVMYEGWTGALKAAAVTETSLFVPVNFEIIESKNGEGDIIIELTNRRNADGFAGWTNSIADESQNQILKSRITIFAADTLSNTAVETIVRHEMGHGLGLAHSSASEDLMYPSIETNFPYISDCDIDAMVLLYDGGNTSEVECKI